MQLSDFLSKDIIKLNLEGTTKEEVISELIEILYKNKIIDNKENVVKSLLDREKLGTIEIGQGVALSHVKIDNLNKIVILLGISKKGIDFNSLDGEPVYIILVFLLPNNPNNDYLKMLAKASQLLKDKYFRKPLKELNSVDEILSLIKEEE